MFIYDHLDGLNELERASKTGSRKLFQMIKTYMKRSTILGRSMFKECDMDEKNA